MSDPFIGQIDLFPYTFVPDGYLACDGQIYSISQYQPLYALIGNIYGGSYQQQTFAVPNLQGRAFAGVGTVPGGQIAWTLGKSTGDASVTLTQQTMPAHTHAFNVLGVLGTDAVPSATDALSSTHSGEKWAVAAADTTLSPQSLSAGYTGPGAHGNMQPYTVLRPCIAYVGLFPVSD